MDTKDTKGLTTEGDSYYTFRAWRFSIRELLLAVVVGTLLVVGLILIAFMAKSSSDLRQAQSGARAAERACKGSTCLRTAAHIMELLNTSVDPCDNFFDFACGGYRVKNPVDEYTLYQSIHTQMRQKNQNQLMAILNSASKRYTDWSYERKAKDFFTSCMDDFRKEQLKGTPLFEHVFPVMGGWYVTDGAAWSSASWDLNTAVKLAQTDMWIDPFWVTRVRIDQFDSKKWIITLFPVVAGNHVEWSDFSDSTNKPKLKKVQEDYKKYMRTVAQLIVRDKGLTTSNDQSLSSRIEDFVADAYDMESRLAKLALGMAYKDRYTDARKMTLRDLTQTTGGVIDWTLQMSYKFDGANVNGDTQVLVVHPAFFTNLTAMISGLDPSTKSRKIHNYLIWRVLEVYLSFLSTDYRQADRQLHADKFGESSFESTESSCFYYTEHYYNIALGALYVNARFDMRNKKKVTEITEAMKTALEDMLQKNSWMDQTTKDYAIAKMKNSKYKLGFPDFMVDETKVDDVYRELSINKSDWFGNVMASNAQDRRQWKRRLTETFDPNQWYFDPYDAWAFVIWSLDEIVVPAGLMRFPTYEYDMPHYSSFGAIGTLLGRAAHYLIDEGGRRWDSGGDYIEAPEGWWSKQTLHNYMEAKQCVADLYSKVTQGPYVTKNGDQTFVNVNGSQFAWHAMSLTTGVRLAYNAYQSWQQKYGQDSLSPGLQYSPLQLFFIARAQMYCYNLDPYYEYLYALHGRVHQKTRVNLALKELSEFRQTFQCQASDNMVSTKPCTYY